MAEIRYVVRGAKVKCTQGSSSTCLNLPKSHGVYVDNKPVLNATDSAPGTNVMPFGKCKVLKGPCSPSLKQWQNTQLDTQIQGQPAVIKASTLSCDIGGGITIESDGQ